MSSPRRFTALLAFAASILLTACAEEPQVVSGDCADVFGAQICTWAVMDGDAVVELGATVPIAAIEAAPADQEMTWPPAQAAAIPLPDEVRASLGMDHLGVNWEAHGHPPTAFLTPHFDFHFYNIDRQAVLEIDCSDLSKPATPPTGYLLPDMEIPELGMLEGLCVPEMGMHALRQDEMDDTDPFDGTMVVGYYGGEPIFFEPMISKAALMKQADFTLPMPTVAGLPAGVRYPTDFRAQFDSETRQYRFVFSGFATD